MKMITTTLVTLAAGIYIGKAAIEIAGIKGTAGAKEAVTTAIGKAKEAVSAAKTSVEEGLAQAKAEKETQARRLLLGQMMDEASPAAKAKIAELLSE